VRNSQQEELSIYSFRVEHVSSNNKKYVAQRVDVCAKSLAAAYELMHEKFKSHLIQHFSTYAITDGLVLDWALPQ